MRWLKAAVLASASVAALSASPACAETRSYVVTMFWHALDTRDDDCPNGINPKIEVQYQKDLELLGYSKQEAADMIKRDGDRGEDSNRGWETDKLGHILIDRARIGGKPVNAFMHPYATIDPNLITKVGKYAHGFNLDGKNEAPGNFQNPDTGETGIDHQLARVFGCFENMRGTLKAGSAFWLYKWSSIKETAPAWYVTVTGADLSKDGPVTIRLGETMEAVRFNGNGIGRPNMTYRQDPDPAFAKNVYDGEIKNGHIRITKPGALYMEQDPLLFPVFSMEKFNADLKINPDGSLVGLIGGYQPIKEIYFAVAAPSLESESNYAIDFPGMYYSLRKNADYGYDEKMKSNRLISATYQIMAVPAHVAPVPNRNVTN